jgi:adenosylcobinamide-GDP ribazoletransferase
VITTELRRVATAATFLTRLPWVARAASGDPVELGRSARWFPLIGIVVGAAGGLVYVGASALWSPGIAALLALAAMVLMTGAFHEDGWADSFDGLFGGWTIERRLEIMRDSRIGTYGALALVLLMLGKWQALASLDPVSAPWVLVAAHAAARWSTLPMARALPYARDAGAMKPVASGIGTTELLIGSAVMLAVLLGLAHGVSESLALAGVIATLLLVTGAARLFRARLGGITGDGLGATNQAIELAWLLIAAAILSE